MLVVVSPVLVVVSPVVVVVSPVVVVVYPVVVVVSPNSNTFNYYSKVIHIINIINTILPEISVGNIRTQAVMTPPSMMSVEKEVRMIIDFGLIIVRGRVSCICHLFHLTKIRLKCGVRGG